MSIEYLPGADNVVANPLSRIEFPRLPVEIELNELAEQQTVDVELKKICDDANVLLSLKRI